MSGSDQNSSAAAGGAVHAALDPEQLARIMRGYRVLKRKFMTLQEDHKELQGVHRKVSQDFEVLSRQKEATEEEYNRLYAQWDSHLKSQTSEIEELQKQIVSPQELQQLKLEMVRDMLEAHEQERASLKKRIATEQTAAAEAKRETLLLREDYTNHTDRLKQQVAQMQAQVADKDRRLHMVHDQLDDVRAGHKENADRLQQELYNLQVEKKTWETQAAQSAQKAQETERRLREVTVQSEKTVREANTRVARLEQELQVARDEVAASRDEHRRAQQDIDELRRLVAARDRDLHNVRADLRARTAELQSYREKTETRQDELKRTHHDMTERLQQELSQVRKDLREMTEAKEAATSQNSTQQLRAEAELRHVRDEEVQKRREVEAQRKEVESRLLLVQQSQASLKEAHAEQIEMMRREMSNLRSDMERLGSERRALADKNEELVRENMQLTGDVEDQSVELHEVRHELEQLQGEHRELLSERSKWDMEAQRIVSLTHSIRATEQQHSEELAQIEADRQQERDAWLQEREAMLRRIEQLEAEIERVESDGAHDLTTVKRERHHFKKAYSVLRSRVAALIKEVAGVKKEHDITMQTKAFELESLQRQLRDVEKQRDELKIRLSVSGGGMSVVGGGGGGGAGGGLVPGASTELVDDEAKTRDEINSMLARLQIVSGGLSTSVASSPSARARRDLDRSQDSHTLSADDGLMSVGRRSQQQQQQQQIVISDREYDDEFEDDFDDDRDHDDHGADMGAGAGADVRGMSDEAKDSGLSPLNRKQTRQQRRRRGARRGANS